MREGIVIAVAQPRCVSFDVAANALTHAAAIRAASARVVVFPELSLTGYELDAPTDRRRRPSIGADRCRLCRDWLARARRRTGGGRGRPATHRPAWPSTAAGRPWPTGRPGWAAPRPTDSHRATGPPSSRSTGGGWVWRSARTPASRNTPRTPRRSGSTPTSPGPANPPRTRRGRTSERVASPPITTSGWRSRALPVRRAAGTPTRPAAPGSGRRTVLSWSRRAMSRARWFGRR